MKKEKLNIKIKIKNNYLRVGVFEEEPYTANHYLIKGGVEKIKEFKKLLKNDYNENNPDFNLSFLISSPFNKLKEKLDGLREEIKNRAEKFKKENVFNMTRFNEAINGTTEKRMKREILIFNLNKKLYTDKEYRVIEEHIDYILRLGRSFGINIIIFLKKGRKNTEIEKRILSNLPTSINYFNKNVVIVNYKYEQPKSFDVLYL